MRKVLFLAIFLLLFSIKIEAAPRWDYIDMTIGGQFNSPISPNVIKQNIKSRMEGISYDFVTEENGMDSFTLMTNHFSYKVVVDVSWDIPGSYYVSIHLEPYFLDVPVDQTSGWMLCRRLMRFFIFY